MPTLRLTPPGWFRGDRTRALAQQKGTGAEAVTKGCGISYTFM